MKMQTLEELLVDQLKDIYSAEQQLTKALPKMAKGASDESLRQAIEDHLGETEGQVERLEKISKMLGKPLKGKKCKGMEGLIEEGKEILEQEGLGAIIDAGIIAAAQRVEHYEISAYGSARALCEQLGLRDVAELLEATLQEESAADEKLTEICEGTVFSEAMNGGEEKEDDGATRKTNGRRGQKKMAGARR